MTHDKLMIILNSVFTTPLGFLYIIMLTHQWRFSKEITRNILITFFVFIITFDLSIFLVMGTQPQIQLFIELTNTVLSLAVLFAVSKYAHGQLLFNLFTGCDFIYIISTAGSLIHIQNEELLLLIKFLIYIVIFIITKYYLLSPFLTAMQWLTRGWQCLAMIPLSLYINFFLAERKADNRIMSLSLCFTVFCVYLSFYYVFRIYREQIRIKEDNALLYAQMHAIEKHAETLQTVFEDVRIFRHDMRHYFHMISHFLEIEDYDNARLIINSVTQNIEDIFSKQKIHIYTGRPVIDAIFSFYSTKASEANIKLHIEMELWDSVSIDFVEFGVVLSNSLENAINACCKIPLGSPRKIYIKGSQNRQQYFFQIKNTYAGAIHFNTKNMPITSKANHGYGTQSIKAFVQKYNGILNYEAKNGWFKLQILL